MIPTTTQLAKDLHNLGDNFVIAVDEDGVEYIVSASKHDVVTDHPDLDIL